MKTTYADLAQMIGVTEGDVKSFVSCISLHMENGSSLNQAIEKHMNIMKSMVNKSVEFSNSEHGRAFVVQTFTGA